MISPTRPQGDVLRFVTGFIEAHGYSPSFDEIAEGVGFKRRSSVTFHMRGLEERGHVSRMPNRDRAIQVLAAPPIPRTPEGEPLFLVPLNGRAA